MRPSNAGLRMYGGAAFERVLIEFRCAACSLDCPPISRVEVRKSTFPQHDTEVRYKLMDNTSTVSNRRNNIYPHSNHLRLAFVNCCCARNNNLGKTTIALCFDSIRRHCNQVGRQYTSRTSRSSGCCGSSRNNRPSRSQILARSTAGNRLRSPGSHPQQSVRSRSGAHSHPRIL